LLGLFIIPSVFAEFINFIFQTRWGSLLSLSALMKSVTDGLFGLFERVWAPIVIRDFDDNVIRELQLIEPPLWCSWAALFFVCAICLALLAWKVKAYEVVK
jgi:hypothetical protein